jgi:hypothetical protein
MRRSVSVPLWWGLDQLHSFHTNLALLAWRLALIPPDQQFKGFVVALQTSFDPALIVVRHGFFLPGRTIGGSKSFGKKCAAREVLLTALEVRQIVRA